MPAAARALDPALEARPRLLGALHAALERVELEQRLRSPVVEIGILGPQLVGLALKRVRIVRTRSAGDHEGNREAETGAEQEECRTPMPGDAGAQGSVTLPERDHVVHGSFCDKCHLERRKRQEIARVPWQPGRWPIDPRQDILLASPAVPQPSVRCDPDGPGSE